MLSWWSFLLLGPTLTDTTATVLSFLTPSTFAALLTSSLLFFAGLHLLLRAHLPLPARFTADDRAAALAWAGAFAHHVPVCALAVATLGGAFFAPGSVPPVPLWVLAWSVPFSLAYVIADTVVTCIPQLLRSPPEYEMTLHHVLGLVVTCAALLAPPELLRAWAAACAVNRRRDALPPCSSPAPHAPPPAQAGRPTCGCASCQIWGWA